MSFLISSHNSGKVSLKSVLIMAIVTAGIPLAIKGSQNALTLQNRAATYLQEGEGDCSQKACAPGLECTRSTNQWICKNQGGIECADVSSLKNQFCNSDDTVKDGIPCHELIALYDQNCLTAIGVSSPSPVPTTIPNCINGTTKTVSQFNFICTNGVWKYSPTAKTKTQPTSTPAQVKCIQNSVKMVNSFRFVCDTNGNWKYQPLTQTIKQ